MIEKPKEERKGPYKNQLLPDSWGHGDTYMLDPVCAGTGRGKDTPQRDLGFSTFEPHYLPAAPLLV